MHSEGDTRKGNRHITSLDLFIAFMLFAVVIRMKKQIFMTKQHDFIVMKSSVAPCWIQVMQRLHCNNYNKMKRVDMIPINYKRT